MKATYTSTKYMDQLTAEDMHKNTIEWLSDLEFMKDEQLFFDDLIKSYTLQLIDSKHYKESKTIIDTLSKLQKKTDLFIKYLKNHNNDLKIIVDDINQPKEEKGYKKEHQGFVVQMNDFVKEYRALKTKLFNLIKSIKKEVKQEHIIDRT